MSEKAESMFAAIAEFLSPSSRRYVETLAPLMIKRATNGNKSVRKVALFGNAA